MVGFVDDPVVKVIVIENGYRVMKKRREEREESETEENKKKRQSKTSLRFLGNRGDG